MITRLLTGIIVERSQNADQPASLRRSLPLRKNEKIVGFRDGIDSASVARFPGNGAPGDDPFHLNSLASLASWRFPTEQLTEPPRRQGHQEMSGNEQQYRRKSAQESPENEEQDLIHPVCGFCARLRQTAFNGQKIFHTRFRGMRTDGLKSAKGKLPLGNWPMGN